MSATSSIRWIFFFFYIIKSIRVALHRIVKGNTTKTGMNLHILCEMKQVPDVKSQVELQVPSSDFERTAVKSACHSHSDPDLTLTPSLTPPSDTSITRTGAHPPLRPAEVPVWPAVPTRSNQLAGSPHQLQPADRQSRTAGQFSRSADGGRGWRDPVQRAKTSTGGGPER